MDLFHAVSFAATLISFVALRLTGHSDVTADNALFSLASLIAGSYVRGKLPTDTK